MADNFKVYDMRTKSSFNGTFSEVCEKYPFAKLEFLAPVMITMISLYDKGNKVAIIKRVKEN